jgi:hypothetical protein
MNTVTDDAASGASFLAELKDRARQEIPSLQGKIEALMEPYDAFDWLSNLFFGNAVIDPDRYRESTFQGLSAVVEYAACQLVLRRGRAGSSDQRFIDAGTYSEAVENIKSLLRWAAMGSLYVPDAAKDGTDALRHSVMGRRMFLRHPVFEHQERNILEALFGGDFDEHLRAEVGFTVGEALAICDAFRTVPFSRLRQRSEVARASAIEARTRRRSPVDPLSALRKFKKLPGMYRMAATAMTFDALGDTVALRAEDLEETAGVDGESIKAFLDLFTLEFGYAVPDGADWLAGFAAGYNPVLRRPIVHDGAGNYLCVGPGLLFFAFRDVLEEQLSDSQRRELFYRRRGRFIEDETARILQFGVRPDLIEVGMKYEFDGGVTDADVLAVVGTVAFVAEGKAKLLSEAARRAAPKSLASELDEIVKHGGDQADRVRKLVSLQGGLQIVRDDGTREWLDLGHVSRVLPMVVTLEDLGWIGAAIEPLIEAGLATDDQAPLVVGLHDLEIMCDLVEFPAQLVHYFIRRFDVNRLRAIAAMDELDYFMHYLMSGLMFDDLLKEHGPLTHVFVSSLTDDLDAYYMHAAGIRRKPAKKPRQRMPKHMRHVLEQLDAERPDGWLGGSLGLLDIDGEGREQLAKVHGATRRMSDKDGRFHDASLLFGEFGVTVMSAPEGFAGVLPNRISAYCRAKRFQLGKPQWFGFGLGDLAPGYGYTTYVAVREPFESDAELEALCRSLGLAPTAP